MRQVSPKPLLTNALPRRVLIKVSLQIINFYKQRKFRSARKDRFKFTGGWMKPPPAHHIPSPLCPAPARCQGLALPQQSSPHHLKSLAAHQLSACFSQTPLYFLSSHATLHQPLLESFTWSQEKTASIFPSNFALHCRFSKLFQRSHIIFSS